ncbi:MAG: hypothetical protein KIPDCIKN_04360 [Haliscomenobacter sp.]|nr:hypothetical protein [Haliscomenobacter sp.]
METAVLTEKQLDDLVGGLKDANSALVEARKKMDENNTKVGELLAEQKKLKDEGGTQGARIDKIQADLTGLADKMTAIATQFTNYCDVTRQHMKALADSGQKQDTAYRYRGQGIIQNGQEVGGRGTGAIFESRQQALEIGMWLLASQKYNGEGKRNARAWLKEHRQDLRYLPNVPSDFPSFLGQDWIGGFHQRLRQNPDTILAQDLSGTASPGSVLTTPEFVRTLIRNVELHGKFRQNATVWPMGSNEVWIPRRRGGFTVYWEGEGEAMTTSDIDVDLLKMVAKKATVFHAYSNELNVDSAIALADALMFEVSLAFASEEDRIGFNGTGAGGNGAAGYAGFFGVLGMPNTDTATQPLLVTGAAGNDLTTEVTEAKLRAMTGLLPTWARAGAKWFMDKTILADLSAIARGTAGGPVVDFRDGLPPSIMGYPVVEVDRMPDSPSAASTKVFFLGDLRRAWYLGDRMGVEVETSEHYLWNKDQISLRAKERIGFLPAQANGCVVYKTGTA